MALQNSATINGITYTPGKTFKARVSFTGKAASDGSGNNSTITQGSQYNFRFYNPGSAYPYAIGTGTSSTVRCWVKATVFPYATYSVKYDANGGTGAPGAQTKTYGSNLKLSSTVPKRTGYNFKGWATSKTGSVIYSPGATYTANSGVTLYAVWSPYTHKVAYDGNGNGGAGVPGSQTKTYGSTLTLSSAKPTWTGHTFLRWNTKADGSGTNYSPGATYGADQNGGTVTLYAIWSLNSFTLTFDANGGTGAPDSVTKLYGQDIILPVKAPTRPGHTFLGWSTSSGASSPTYTAGGTFTQNSSVTLYAVWKINTYSITFDASTNGGEGNRVITVNYGSTISNLPVATKKYYVFIGWFTSASGGTEITSDTVFTKDMTVYAQYVIDASINVWDGGKENPGFPYVWSNGAWRKGYAYVRDNSKWKQGLS